MKALRTCAQPGCPTVVVGGYCAKHQPARPPENDRPSPSKRGYDAKWAKTRRMFLRQHPVCSMCDRDAVDVHHLQSLHDGGTNALDNLIALCHQHHSMITGKTQGWGRRRDR